MLPSDREGLCVAALLAFTLSGAVLPYARLPSLFAALWVGAFFLGRHPCFSERRVLCLLSLLGAVTGGYALWRYALYGGLAGYTDPAQAIPDRAAGSFGNPNLLAAFLAPCLVAAVALALSERRARLRLPHAAAALVTVAALWLTYSRGAWLAVGVSLLFFLCIRAASPMPLLWTCAALPLLLLLLPHDLLARVRAVFSGDSSIAYRLSLWRATGEAIAAFPLFGAGEGREAFRRAITPYAAAGLEAAEHAHSLFLHLPLAVGLLGSVPFFLLLFFFFSRVRRRPAVCACLLSLLIYGLFDDPLYAPPLAVLLFFLLGVGKPKPEGDLLCNTKDARSYF